MNHFLIPACFYPTTVLLVDDDVLQSELLAMQLESHGTCNVFKGKVFESGESALNFLKDYKSPSLMKKYMLIDEDDGALGRSIKINIAGIQETALNINRFEEITVGVIDYHMPIMNGIQLCKAIREKYPKIKLIMLTAEADNELAIKAHNEKIIDLFVRKDLKNSPDTLLVMIHNLQLDYFRDQSSVLVESFLNSSEGYPECLNDPIFADFFFKALKGRQIIEFYIINSFGDFLLLDKNGNKSWLMIRTEQSLRLSYEIAEYAAEDNQDDVLRNMAKNIELGNIAPFFENELISDIPPEHWASYLQSLTTIQGNNVYYYAFIDHTR